MKASQSLKWRNIAAILPPLRETLIAPDPDDPGATIMDLDEIVKYKTACLVEGKK
jgi:hypothetical protein